MPKDFGVVTRGGRGRRYHEVVEKTGYHRGTIHGTYITRGDASAAARELQAELNRKQRGNPKRSTKAQRKRNASKRAKDKRIAAALKKFLSVKNPGRKVPSRVRVRRNKGGSITIIPMK